MLFQDDSDFFIKPNAFLKLLKQGKPKTTEMSRRKPQNVVANKKQLNILHFSKPIFLLQIPEESKSNRNISNNTCRSWNTQSHTPDRRKILLTSPKESRLGYKVQNKQDPEVPYEIHTQMPTSQINPKYVIQQKQGCGLSRLPNFKLQIINQFPNLRQLMLMKQQ
ncbi:unnamed protein product (macronuclear) [Paramecium tetraurelia]|uniref:Uncharacterized protein n=1 Tax=Paramecium tetraurelia TaxID=5888 RepID=A0BRG2_PARTE|nr:uncharacterized protein GSPATT00031360001 [Paramecium tetraurelia]CAK61129.1 unnamed protein product [Paramecium tetraurelia]|eukprot:XP_001428527.1 hypothetical protein (macronuclear) [Paramecium tetraurelia strain d4-2]